MVVSAEDDRLFRHHLIRRLGLRPGGNVNHRRRGARGKAAGRLEPSTKSFADANAGGGARSGWVAGSPRRMVSLLAGALAVVFSLVACTEPSPEAMVAQALRCKPKPSGTCALADDPDGLTENLYPWTEILSARRETGGGISAWVLRYRARGETGGALYRYLFDRRGALVSRECVRSTRRHGRRVLGMAPPDVLNGERYMFTDACNESRVEAWKRQRARGPAPREIFATSTDVPLYSIEGHFPNRSFEVPEGRAFVRSRSGPAYRARPGIVNQLYLLQTEARSSEERERRAWIVQQAERGRAEVFDLEIGDDVAGMVLYLEAGTRVVVEVEGLPVVFETRSTGAQIELLPRSDWKAGWRALREELVTLDARNGEAAIWSPPLALVGDRLFRLDHQGASLVCSRFSAVDLCDGRCDGLRTILPGARTSATSFFVDGSSLLLWSGRVLGGRCLEP